MYKIKIAVFFLFLFTQCTFTQIEDIFKKIPGLSDVFEEAVTTSIKDAYPSAYWLNDVDKKINQTYGTGFSENLGSGYYKYRFNTFCLHAGNYAPTEGAGYLVAPLKGAKATLIKHILSRYGEHPEINQKDVQMLVWGIEAGQKFSNYPPDFQVRITPLLKPEEIALMEVDVKEIGYDLLPDEVKNVLYLYKDIRGKLSDVNSTYEDVEKIAVKTGIAPIGKGSKNIPAGTWTSVGDNVFIRCFPQGFPKTDVEIYIPADVKIKKDNNGNIVSLDDGTTEMNFSYEPGAQQFKSAVIRNISSNEEFSVDNTISDASSGKKDADDFMKLVKKSFGKKKAKRLTGESSKTITQLKSIEYSLKQLISDKSDLQQNGYEVSVNALNNFIGSLESGNKKGGGSSHKSGLGNINGLVFAPANTSNQRLGNGGPEGGNGNEGNNENGDPNKNKEKEKPCNVSALMHQVPENDLPVPDHVYTVDIDISIEGEDEKCQAEEINFTLYDISEERGRYMNDNEKYDDLEEDLQFSDLNQGFEMTKTTAKKQISGKSQTLQIAIWCGDYGAFGKLKASVKVNGKWYEADGDGTPDKYITIPLDLNNNKIADSWEKQNNVYGLPAEWDEDPQPSGQGDVGDGMTNYEEYRGFFISDGSGGTEHKRMNPKLREIFVIDEGEIFSPVSWKAATGIQAYWLTSAMVNGPRGGGVEDNDYRLVNFCSGFAKGNKYAINVIKADGMDDPFGKEPGKYIFGYNIGSPPKNAKLTVIFPKRLENWIMEQADTLANLLKKFPNGYMIGGTLYSASVVKNFVKAIKDNAKRQYILDYLVYSTVIHEMGHSCNVPHHGGGDPLKTGTGVLSCPMIYTDGSDEASRTSRLVYFLNHYKKGEYLIVDYISLKFCKKKDNCYKKIKINDRK